MTWPWRLAAVAGWLTTVLGMFWLAQGIGLVKIDPILCAGSCEPVEAPSLQWQITGLLTGLGGAATGVLVTRRARSKCSRQ